MLPNVERRDLGWASRLLRAELVAREEQEAEAARFVLAPKRDEPGHLPNISQASDVDDEDHLACENVERDVLARVGPGAQIRERGHGAVRSRSQHGAGPGGKTRTQFPAYRHSGIRSCLAVGRYKRQPLAVSTYHTRACSHA